MEPLSEEEGPLVRRGRHHAHAVKVGNGRRAKRRKAAVKKVRSVTLLQGVLVNGQPFGVPS